MTDIEIARNTKLDNIVDVAKKVDVKEDDLETYTFTYVLDKETSKYRFYSLSYN